MSEAVSPAPGCITSRVCRTLSRVKLPHRRPASHRSAFWFVVVVVGLIIYGLPTSKPTATSVPAVPVPQTVAPVAATPVAPIQVVKPHKLKPATNRATAQKPGETPGTDGVPCCSRIRRTKPKITPEYLSAVTRVAKALSSLAFRSGPIEVCPT